MGANISINNETRGTLPRVSFGPIKEAILGKAYRLNVVITSPAAIKKLNLMYRNKNVATDILSFPLSKKEGDIYLCLSAARSEAKKFDRTYQNFLSFLFIHGCVHLKGYEHGVTMERIETKFRKKFGI